MTSISFWTLTINGRLYPVKARTGNYAYAHEVWREGKNVMTRYLGIMRVPDNGNVVKKKVKGDSSCEAVETKEVIVARV